MSKTIWLYGIHPIEEVLKAGKKEVLEILITDKTKEKLSSNDVFRTSFKNISTQIVEAKTLNNILAEGVNHQNIAIKTFANEIEDINDFYHKNEDNIVILDQITDTHNIGAIIRSALAFGFKNIALTSRNSISDYDILLKSSAGLSEYVNFYQMNNINQNIAKLKQQEFWCIGLEGSSKVSIGNLKKFDKLALILGNEHKGIRDLVKKNCDLLVSIPMDPQAESLNVASSATIAFWEVFKNKNF